MTKIKTAVLIFIVTIIAYGQTLFMYFWIDDNALIYKLQHLSQNIGFWGTGIFGSGPYRHIIEQYIPFYPIFKTNPAPYYAVGIILYFLMAYCFYLFVKKVFQDEKLALASSLIVASGYVASETIFGMMNSWQTSRGIIMFLLTLYLYWRFMQKDKTIKRFIFYLCSLVLFYFCLDTVFIRAHGLVFVIFFFDFIFYPGKKTFKSLMDTIVRQLPFLFVHYHIYLSDLGLAKKFALFDLFRYAVVEKKWYLLTIPFQDLGNIFIPDKISNHLSIIINKVILLPPDYSIGSTLSGILFIALSIYTISRFHKKNIKEIKILLFSLVWIVANFIVYYGLESTHSLSTTHRYLSYSFLGLALFWSTIFLLINKTKRGFYFLTGLLVSLFLSLGLIYQYQFNQRRSFPIKRFYQVFRQSIPAIPKDAVIYFDIANDNRVKGEFGSFFGGMFSEGANLSIYTPNIDYMKDFSVTFDFKDVIKAYKDRKSMDKIYTFYYGQSGLIDTTSQTGKVLGNSKGISLSDKNYKYSFNHNDFTGEIVLESEVPSLVSSQLQFDMRITPSVPSVFSFFSGSKRLNLPTDEKQLYFDYLLSREEYYRLTKAFSVSFWKEQKATFVLDQRTDTSWRGNRGYWNEYSKGRESTKESLTVNLGSVREVGAISWLTSQKPLIPVKYQLQVSMDGAQWKVVKDVERYQSFSEGTEILDKFDDVTCRFVRMVVEKTYGDDGPEIEEFEVIESRYKDLDRKLTRIILENPFTDISNMYEYSKAFNLVKNNLSVQFSWLSSADSSQDPDNYVKLITIADGQYHKYKISLPASGLLWKSFSIGKIGLPSNVEIRSIEFKYE